MKSARLPNDRGGESWVLIHDLVAVGHPHAGLRPFNYLTFFAQSLAGGRKDVAYRYAMALEDKLAGVRLFHRELRGAIAQAGRVGEPVGYLRGYEDEQRIGCMLEGLLNAIYSSLELTAKLNSCFHPRLPWGFRDQAKKSRWPVFRFDRWPWLPRFFDVRTQLAHFGTALPVVSGGKLAISFSLDSLEIFPKGLAEVHLTEADGYAFALFEMLDTWAVEELNRLDPDQEFDVVSEPRSGTALQTGKRKAAEILASMNLAANEHHAARKVQQFIGSLASFQLVAPSELYTHMGALLADGVLQAGIAYKTVVLPRVRVLLARPEASTTSGFLELLGSERAESVLKWHGKKLATLVAVATLLKVEAVETATALRSWLRVAENQAKLRSVKGVGDKTLDYFQMLSGLSSVAVDVHLKQFLLLAGVQISTYDGARRVLVEVARLLGVDATHLDHSIWLYMSEGEGKRERQATSRGKEAGCPT